MKKNVQLKVRASICFHFLSVNTFLVCQHKILSMLNDRYFIIDNNMYNNVHVH